MALVSEMSRPLRGLPEIPFQDQSKKTVHTILFVDDNRNIREFCGQELAREGYRVLLAGDGDEALRVLSQHSPDLVIMDVVMPRKDGISAAGQLLARHRDVPVIFHTSHKDYVDHRGGGLAEACVEK